MDFSGKLALVTGGSRGIGREICLTLAEYGADVAVNYVRDDEGNNLRDALEVAGKVEKFGRRTGIFEADVSSYEAVSLMAGAISSQLGTIYILVNNAAVLHDKTLKKMSPEEWHSVIDINLTGVFNASRAVIEPMIEKGWGRIISLSSISGQTGFWGQTNYAASKSGVMGFTKSLAREVAGKNITVNAVAPGLVETEMAKLIHEERRSEYLKQIPMGRFAEPREIAEVVAFLVSNRAAYITGQTIHVNGGWYM